MDFQKVEYQRWLTRIETDDKELMSFVISVFSRKNIFSQKSFKKFYFIAEEMNQIIWECEKQICQETEDFSVKKIRVGILQDYLGPFNPFHTGTSRKK